MSRRWPSYTRRGRRPLAKYRAAPSSPSEALTTDCDRRLGSSSPVVSKNYVTAVSNSCSLYFGLPTLGGGELSLRENGSNSKRRRIKTHRVAICTSPPQVAQRTKFLVRIENRLHECVSLCPRRMRRIIRVHYLSTVRTLIGWRGENNKPPARALLVSIGFTHHALVSFVRWLHSPQEPNGELHMSWDSPFV